MPTQRDAVLCSHTPCFLPPRHSTAHFPLWTVRTPTNLVAYTARIVYVSGRRVRLPLSNWPLRHEARALTLGAWPPCQGRFRGNANDTRPAR